MHWNPGPGETVPEFIESVLSISEDSTDEPPVGRMHGDIGVYLR